MSTQLHGNATTTPRTQRYIQESDKVTTQLARELGLSETTVRKWKRSPTVEDGSHVPQWIPTPMPPETEVVQVELRKLFLLPVDDLLRLARDFLDPNLSRSALQRCLRRNGVSNLKALRAEQLRESEDTTRARKTFKDYEPGFVHADIKYLPQLPEESDRRYLYVAIDRASKWVYFEVRDDRKATTALSFVSNLIRRAPFRITHLLTDNDGAFTDRLSQPTGQSGRHAVDQLCAAQGIEHRLIPPRRPQTNGLVERFNG